MNKRIVYILLALSIIANAILVGFIFFDNRTLTDNEIKEKFACDRVTQDIRETDIFCNKPELYRKANI